MKSQRCLICARTFDGTGSICPMCAEKVQNESKGRRKRQVGGGLGKAEKATNQNQDGQDKTEE